MNKKISLGSAIAYMAIVAAVAVSLTMIYSRNLFNQKLRDLSEREAMYSAVFELDQYVRSNYYKDVDDDQLNSSTMAGYIAGLGDPYARLMTAREYEVYQSEDGKYTGIGIVSELAADGYIRVAEVYPDSPAEAAGIAAGDLITSVDGVQVNSSDASYEERAASFRGDAGTKITLVRRRGTEDITLELTRRQVEVPTIRSSTLSDGNGYIRITGIGSSTGAQFEKAVKQMESDGVSALIFDVRGLETDSMKTVSDMLDILLPRITTVYITRADGVMETLYTSDESSVPLPMVVLADESTKGASEMFAYALRDCGAARVVGIKTFGKGTLQEVKKLRDGSAVMLTTAYYSGPAGGTYDLTGVTPDYEVELGVEAANRNNVLGDPELDVQLKKAQEVALSLARAASNAS